MMMKNKFVLVTMTCLLMILGCQNKNPDVHKDPLDENYRLIDRGDYSQAISRLSDLSQQDQRPQVRVALASAYAARAGIKVEQYWGFVIGFKAPLLKTDNIQVNATIDSLQKIAKKAKGQMDEHDMQALSGLIRALATWDRYQERIDAIPVVTGDSLTDLDRAVEVLANVQTPGGRLYRAILNLILFKSYVVASKDYWSSFDQVVKRVISGDIQNLCQYNFNVLLG